MIDFKDITFTIPVRIDSDKRFNILLVVLKFLLKNFDSHFIILEDGIESVVSKRLPKDILEKIEYIYQKSDNNLFHRTRILNEMACKSKTKIVVNHDGDLICDPSLYLSAANQVRNPETPFATPYDGRVLYLKNDSEIIFENSDFDIGILNNIPTIHSSCASRGGIVFSRLKEYIEVGMENENFMSWGYEDDDRNHRFNVFKKFIRISGTLYHFEHARGQNSGFDNPLLKKNLEERAKVLGMKHEELLNYISTWHWRIKALKNIEN